MATQAQSDSSAVLSWAQPMIWTSCSIIALGILRQVSYNGVCMPQAVAVVPCGSRALQPTASGNAAQERHHAVHGDLNGRHVEYAQ